MTSDQPSWRLRSTLATENSPSPRIAYSYAQVIYTKAVQSILAPSDQTPPPATVQTTKCMTRVAIFLANHVVRQLVVLNEHEAILGQV